MADIFISRRIFDEAVEMLEEEGHTLEINDSSRILPKNELQAKVEDKDGLICLLNDEVGPNLMDLSRNLKVVSNVAVGYDNIDVETATERGIMVTNTPGVLTETTADMSFALLMSAARRTPEADRYSRADKYKGWELVQPHMGVDVYGKTLGICGLGRIGEVVARRGKKGFEMEIVYNDIERNKEAEAELDAEFMDFERLLEVSDFISIHTPLTEETHHMFSKEEFKRMKDEAILVNAARGPIVDEYALAEALKSEEIRGAALDVFEQEPQVHPELAKLEKSVALAPHLGSASRETRLKMARMAAENMVTGLEGECPPDLINKEVLS